MSDDHRAMLAARVIAMGRDLAAQSGIAEVHTAAGFDWAIAVGAPKTHTPSWQAENGLQGAIYEIANEGHPYVPGQSAEREARAARLRAELAGELDAYRQRCRERKFTGWSNASRGPIRYADGDRP